MASARTMAELPSEATAVAVQVDFRVAVFGEMV